MLECLLRACFDWPKYKIVSEAEMSDFSVKLAPKVRFCASASDSPDFESHFRPEEWRYEIRSLGPFLA